MYVHVQKGEHVGFTNAHAEKEKGVPVVSRLPDWRVDLQQTWFTELLQSCVQGLARRERVIVCGMNEEHRHFDVSRRVDIERPRGRGCETGAGYKPM